MKIETDLQFFISIDLTYFLDKCFELALIDSDWWLFSCQDNKIIVSSSSSWIAVLIDSEFRINHSDWNWIAANHLHTWIEKSHFW
jgi:hypothetical protein